MKIKYDLDFKFDCRKIYYYNEKGELLKDLRTDEESIEEPLKRGASKPHIMYSGTHITG